MAGFKTSLTRTINNYAKRNNLLKNLTPSGEDLREGLRSSGTVLQVHGRASFVADGDSLWRI